MFSRLFVGYSSNYFWYFAVLGLMAPYLAVFLSGRAFNSVEIGEILAVITATKVIGPTLWAMLSDKTGKQVSIIRLGALLSLIFFIPLFWVDGYWLIMLFLGLFSLFWTAILPQLEVATLTSIRRSAKIYARIRLWGSIGFILIAIIAGDLIERFSSETYLPIGLVILVALFLSSLVIKQPKPPVSAFTKQSSIASKLKATNFVLFFISGMLLQVSFGPYNGFFALYLNQLDYPGYGVGLIIAIGVIAEIGVFVLAGKLFRRFSIKNLLIFSLAVSVLRWHLVGQFGDNTLLLALSQVMHAAGFGLYHSASMQFIQRHFDANQQNRGQAVYISGVYGVGGAIGAYATGVLWLEGAGATQSFTMATLTALAGTLFALLLKEPRQSSAS